MKNLVAVFITLFLASLTTVQISSQDQPTLDQAIADAQDAIHQLVAQGKAIGIAAGAARDGKIIWEGQAGYADQKNKTSYGPSTVSRMASIAKTMTTVAILQLHEKDMLDIEATIDTYLPNYPKDKASKITVRQLMGHSSGIPAYKNKKENNNKKHYNNFNDAMKLFADRDLLAAPGTEHNYTSYGYTVLGAIIEAASGERYETYMKKHIWDVADMTNISVEDATKNYNNQAIAYHRRSNGKVKVAERVDLSDRIPAGGFQCTMSDILKFGMALMDGKLISSASLDLMMTDTGLKKEGNPYGLGLFLYGENAQLGNVVGHTGGQLGCSSFMMLFPESNAVILTASNTSGIGQEVADITVGLFKMVYLAGQ